MTPPGAAPRPIRALVLTVSDRCSKGEAVDRSGPAVIQLLTEKLGAEIVATDCIPDDLETIAATFRQWTQGTPGAPHPPPDIDLILSTGGTGLAPRDVTPEAALRIIERHHPGLMELARLRCYQRTTSSNPAAPNGPAHDPRAFLSRGIAGSVGRTLILTLPGSPRGAAETLEALLDVLPHAIGTLRGPADHSATSTEHTL